MSLGIAPLSSYNPDVCYMEWIDGNYLWIQPASYCTTMDSNNKNNNKSASAVCTWNLAQGLNVEHNWVTWAVPDSDLTHTYICDNQAHQLGFADPSGDPPASQNRYVCSCGQPISSEYVTYNITSNSTTGCQDRCDRPWTPAFNKYCNLVTQDNSTSQAKGNYSAGDVTQGVCLATAAQGPANNTFKSMPQVDIHQYSIIDGIGISQACNIHYDDEVQRICMCDSALPEYAWGRKIENRDPCGLERRANKDWIAAPVIGSVVIAIGIILSIILWHHKQKARLQRQDIPDEIALTSLRSCIV